MADTDTAPEKVQAPVKEPFAEARLEEPALPNLTEPGKAPSSPITTPPLPTPPRDASPPPEALHEETVLEADNPPVEHILDDGDSGFIEFGGGNSWTSSLASSIRRYRSEYGRTYHSYKEGKYNVPNDEQECQRLDLQSHLFLLTLEGKLTEAPIEKVQCVLDIGTGTGIWAIDFAEEHPEAQVIGTDLSPIQPTWVPPNVEFIIDDAEEEWAFGERFDFIHSRQMVGSFANWDAFYEAAYTAIKPGGWFECTDIGEITNDDGEDYSRTGIFQWYATVGKAFDVIGRSIYAAKSHADRMRAAGFEDVHEKLYKWPITPWPKDPKLKEIGLWSRENMLDCLEAWAIVPLTKFLGWSLEETQLSIARARADLRDPKMPIHAYWEIWMVYGRKPARAV